MFILQAQEMSWRGEGVWGRVKAEGGCMWSMHIEVPRHSAHTKSLLLRGEWPLQNPRVFTSRERSFGPPCLDAFHHWSMGGYKMVRLR